MESDAGQSPPSALSACRAFPSSVPGHPPHHPDPQPTSPKNRHAQGSEQWCGQGKVHTGAWTQASREILNELLTTLNLQFLHFKNVKN